MKLETKIYDELMNKLEHSIPRQGGIKSCCPFHWEKTPSFFIYYDNKWQNTWWFKCHGCGETGGLNKLFRRLRLPHLVSPEKRFQPTEEEKDFTVFRVDDTIALPRLYHYFLTRGVSEEVCRKFDFRFDLYHVGAVMPVYMDGFFRGSIRRNLDPYALKYHISTGMQVSKVIWGFDYVDDSQPIYVTEGIIDAACLWSNGLQSVALISKESALGKVKRLASFTKTIIVPDNDQSGIKTARELSRATGATIEFIPPQFKDVSEWCMSRRTGTG